MDILNQLSNVYNNWLDEQKIKDRASADALLWNDNLTDKQRNWLILFIKAWKQSEDSQKYIDKLFIKWNKMTEKDIMKKMKPSKNCSNCDVDGDYICFGCEVNFMEENHPNYFYNDDCEWELREGQMTKDKHSRDEIVLFLMDNDIDFEIIKEHDGKMHVVIKFDEEEKNEL